MAKVKYKYHLNFGLIMKFMAEIFGDLALISALGYLNFAKSSKIFLVTQIHEER